MATYPAAVKTFTAVVNGVTKLVAALFNLPYDEITAIQTELGTNPKGLHADVKTRLNGYDSGWFAATVNTAYTKTHNLGTTKVLIQIYVSDSADGSGKCGIVTGFIYTGSAEGTFMGSLSTTTIVLRTRTSWIYNGFDVDGAAWNVSTEGYLRIIMLALE